jgi:hypothetical protein
MVVFLEQGRLTPRIRRHTRDSGLSLTGITIDRTRCYDQFMRNLDENVTGKVD